VIRKVDKNGDGAIDYDEFTKVTPHPKHKPPPAAESPWSSFMRRRCSCPPGRRCRRRRLVRLCSPHRSSWTRHHQVLQQKKHNLDGGAGASRTLTSQNSRSAQPARPTRRLSKPFPTYTVQAYTLYLTAA
jgi:hypothetical protein